MTTLVLFIHGLGGSGVGTWGEFPRLIQQDPKLASEYTVNYYDYPTRLFPLPFRDKPPIQSLALGLRSEIDNKYQEYSEISLFCHSLGGIVARKYILEEIKSGRNLRVKQLLMFAVPNNGAALAQIANLIPWRYRQLRQICKESYFLDALNSDWETLHVTDKVQVRYIIAGEDRIVSMSSAKAERGNENCEMVIDKDHRSLVKPVSHRDLVYLTAQRFLLEKVDRSVINKPAPVAISPSATGAQPHTQLTPTSISGAIVVETNVVRFETERKPHQIDLQKAVHKILVQKGLVETYRIPLRYDERIAFLMEKLKTLYSEYESRLGKEADGRDLSLLNQAVNNIPRVLNDSLPKLIGLAAVQLSEPAASLDDVFITATISRFVELKMTQVIHWLSRFQLCSDKTILFAEYIKPSDLKGYVAMIDGQPIENMVSYRILFEGDVRERVLFVPADYGHRRLLVLHEFSNKGEGYIPPISFLTDYVFPQMFWWHYDEPSKWNTAIKCESVFVKDSDGHYIS